MKFIHIFPYIKLMFNAQALALPSSSITFFISFHIYLQNQSLRKHIYYLFSFKEFKHKI